MTSIEQFPQTLPKWVINDRAVETVNVEKELRSDDPTAFQVHSGAFIATLNYAGIIKNFQRLQILLKRIGDAENDLHSYASGKLFEDIMEYYYGEDPNALNIFDNVDLFGSTDPPQEVVTIKINLALAQVANVAELINSALSLIDSMYDRVDNILRDLNSDYLSTNARTDHFITWAYRKGMKLNPKLYGIKKIGINTKTEINNTDLYGLLDLFDKLTLELETAKNLPAYYRTGSNNASDKVAIPIKTVIVDKNESINAIAKRELGDPDKSILILEFNDIKYADTLSDDWPGTSLNIPYISPLDTERFVNNFVLDSHAGIEALGRDLPNELISINGDLKVLDYTDNFAQSLSNIILTPIGTVAEQPDYGNRVMQFQGGMIPQILSDSIAVELERALMTNPRVSEIQNIRVTNDSKNASALVKYQVKPINNILEQTLKEHLELL